MKTMGNKIEKIFIIANTVLLTLLAITMLLPLINILAISLSSPLAVDRNIVFFWPVEFTTASWQIILRRTDIWNSFGITVFITVFGTFLSLFLTAITAYPLSKSHFLPRKILMLGMVITMIFHAPMIPYFLTIREIGLYDSVWVLILPSALSAFNIIIMRTFFIELPDELEEAAKIEGANEFHILLKIVFPLSKAIFATVGLFYAVVYWNMFKHAILFISNTNLYPLQLKLRMLIVGAEPASIGGVVMDVTSRAYNARTVLSAAIIFATVPIIMVYPYLQRHFVKGVMVGSVKG